MNLRGWNFEIIFVLSRDKWVGLSIPSLSRSTVACKTGFPHRAQLLALDSGSRRKLIKYSLAQVRVHTYIRAA